MKKTLLLIALAIAGVFTSCSDDNASTNDAQDTSLELLKTVKYIPTKQAYDNNVEGSKKNVQYFEGNKVVADTTFDTSGSIVMRVIHIYTATTHSKQILVNELLTLTQNYIFDNDGRIIERQADLYPSSISSTSINKYVYNTNSITVNAYDPNTNLLMPQYTHTIPLNSFGLVQYEGLSYQDDKPVQWIFTATEESATVNLEYYNVTMPANEIKTINELNNLSLQGEDYGNNLIENNNYYLKKYITTTSPTTSTSFVTFDKTFNEWGYVTYSKAQGTIFENIRDSETFYYYE